MEEHLANSYPIQQPAEQLSYISSKSSDSDLLTVLQQTIPNGPVLKSTLPINEALKPSLKALKRDFDVLNRAQLDVYEIDGKFVTSGALTVNPHSAMIIII